MENTNIPSALRLPFRFDPVKLRTDLAQVSAENWQAHFNSTIYEGEWSGVPLRAVPSSHLAIYSDPTADDQWADTPLLTNCTYFREVLAQFACPLLSVRLLKLAPGAIIKEHRDYSLGLDYGEVRIHVVVKTNPQVECRIDGQSYHWGEGECWYADFGKPHSFANRGKTERVHIVLDCKVDDWLLNLLKDWRKTDVVLKSAPVCGEEGMASFPTPTLDLLRQTLQSNPGLRDRLFEISDAREFAAALSRLAETIGHSVGEDELMAALRQGRRDWIERELP